MSLRPLILSLLPALLAACSSQPVEPPPPAQLPATKPHAQPLSTLSGSLLGAPAGSEVELALLEVDRRDQPDKLLSNLKLSGRGSELPFRLQFNPEAFSERQRVELRGRVTQSGQLIMRLPPRQIHQATDQILGPLRLEPIP